MLTGFCFLARSYPCLDKKYLINVEIKGNQLKASILEWGIYEVLDVMPVSFSFEHAAGLVNLKPRK
ncbi:hypothetical protein EAE89_14555 [Photorhabdus heterorhabditis]|nr:hypothetical protein [Photorhabdus heterorhabditis]